MSVLERIEMLAMSFPTAKQRQQWARERARGLFIDRSTARDRFQMIVLIYGPHSISEPLVDAPVEGK